MRKKRPFLFVLILIFTLSVCLASGQFAAAEPVSAVAKAPSGLTLVRDASGNRLTWQPVEGATAYQVYVSANPEKNFQRIATVKGASFLHKKGKETAFYRVYARVGKVRSEPSAVVGCVTGATGLRLEASKGTLSLHWTAAKYAASYDVEMSLTGNAPWETIAQDVAETRYALTESVTSTRYFRVVSVFGGTRGGASNTVSAFAPVSGVRVLCEEARMTGPTDKLNLCWTPSFGAETYEVYRATLPSEDYALIGRTSETFFPDTRDPLLPYAYKVRPVYLGGAQGALSEAVTLWSGLPRNVSPPAGLTSETSLILVVNKDAQVVTAYVPDASGAYTIPLRHMICSTGRSYDRTRNGTYTLTEKMNEWHRYPSGAYIRYPTIYRSGYYFHSVLYHASRNIMGSTVSRLGTRQSLGCIRLKVTDAKWVYDNAMGAKVYICDGERVPALTRALKPKDVKMN